MSASIFAIFVFALGVIIVFRAVVVVPQGWNYTVERFGKFMVSLGPGLHLITPFIESVGRKMNMMEVWTWMSFLRSVIPSTRACCGW